MVIVSRLMRVIPIVLVLVLIVLAPQSALADKPAGKHDNGRHGPMANPPGHSKAQVQPDCGLVVCEPRAAPPVPGHVNIHPNIHPKITITQVLRGPVVVQPEVEQEPEVEVKVTGSVASVVVPPAPAPVVIGPNVSIVPIAPGTVSQGTVVVPAPGSVQSNVTVVPVVPGVLPPASATITVPPTPSQRT
jgi:hypothetical protein